MMEVDPAQFADRLVSGMSDAIVYEVAPLPDRGDQPVRC
jgi:hypothetical protein